MHFTKPLETRRVFRPSFIVKLNAHTYKNKKSPSAVYLETLETVRIVMRLLSR